MLHAVDELHKGLVKGSAGCGEECSSMLLGVLIKEMDKHKIDQPDFLASCSDQSMGQVRSLLLSFETPIWYRFDCYHERPSKDQCDIKSELMRAIEEVWDELKGLNLDDYRV